MVNETAIEYIEFDKKCLQQDCNGHCRDCVKGNDEDGIMESYNMAIGALKKQIPLKPYKYGDEFFCSACGTILGKYVSGSYCRWCGQKLDWSDD